MSWFEDKKSRQAGYFQSFCYNVLKSGNIPKHVAFIMDGNRRFAKRSQITRKEGHTKGFEKLTEVLQWSFELGIPEITVYAFSIENFKRTEEEVKTLMTLFKEKLDKLYEERAMVMEHEVCVRLVGDLSLFNEEVQMSAARVINMSKNNTKSCLNIAVAYTSRHEITQAIQEVATGVEEGKILTSDINERLLESCFYTSQCRPVDLLIRTSGEIRLSDFLLWQTSYSILSFVDVLWPEFTVWNYMYCILKYQLGYNTIENAKQLSKLKQSRAELDSDLQTAYDNLHQSSSDVISADVVNEHAKQCTAAREERVTRFLEELQSKREHQMIERLIGQVEVT